MPNGMQQFADANGVPYLAGRVYMEVPTTNTPKDNWQDQDHTAVNTYPILLDAAGRCVIWGDGLYRQRLLDHNGVEIWDKLTQSTLSQTDIQNLIDNSITVDVASYYALPVYFNSKPAAGETFPIHKIPFSM